MEGGRVGSEDAVCGRAVEGGLVIVEGGFATVAEGSGAVQAGRLVVSVSGEVECGFGVGALGLEVGEVSFTMSARCVPVGLLESDHWTGNRSASEVVKR